MGRSGPTASTLQKTAVAEIEAPTSTELHDIAVGITEDGDSFQCTFIVPSDYDSTGDPATMTFFGWVPAGEGCGIVACTTPNDVAWDMHWREYANGTSTGETETHSESTNTAQLTGELCVGGSAYCFEDDKMYSFTGDILGNASLWQAGNLIVVRAVRQDDSEDYSQTFNVWLAGVEIDYPN